MKDLDPYLESLYHLNVGVVGKGSDRHERPHKPVMLLTIADLIEAGEIRENRMEWTPQLRKRFGELFDLVRTANDKATPENPFFYLRSESFWRQEAKPGKEDIVEHLSSPPSIGELNQGLIFGSLDKELFELLKSEKGRNEFREAIVSRYFPGKREHLLSLQSKPSIVAEAPVSPVRSSAFRRLILETYDYQCVACGLRIRLPNDFTIVDAAHVIPFSVSFNDHPTNGLALCKNHHWAFDQFLIAPTESGQWRVSDKIEPRRSPGEADLAKLSGERVLPPRDEAFLPSPESVQWRESKLLESHGSARD